MASIENLATYYVVGPGEIVDGTKYPFDWQAQDLTAPEWLEASELSQGLPRGSTTDGTWMLVPRAIPFMEEQEIRFEKIRRTDGLQVDPQFLTGEAPITIPPNSKSSILLDQGQLTNAYPELQLSQGKGALVKISYAETLFESRKEKGNRSEIDGKIFLGNSDYYYSSGGQQQLFSPLWFRTYRYVQLDIETKTEPLTLNDFSGKFTGYPFQEKAQFISDQDFLSDIWTIGWRTARLCAGETYYDCPYYEQIQYVGDTRIQALISLYVSGDDRLMRNAIQQFNNSIIPEGLTMCRAPTHVGQVIPTFSLYWVAMVHDYFQHRDDPSFLKQFLPGIRSVLNWYAERIDETKMLGPLDWWNFADWANGFPNGIPGGADNGNSALLSLTYVYALDYAADLFSHFGLEDESTMYASRASSLKRAVYERCYDSSSRIFADTPEKTEFSQHTNVMAILTDAVPDEEKPGLFERILSDSSLIQTSLYYKFYQMRALSESGLGNRYMELLDPWKKMINLGLSTFPETEPGSKSMVSSRSDCHAWSASPCYDLLATVCGITPAEPGFKSVRIKPQLGSSQKVKCAMPHPAGTLTLELEREGRTGLKGSIVLPEGTTGEFYWNKSSVKLVPGSQIISFK